jgi:Protein of unknown function (DUF3572)
MRETIEPDAEALALEAFVWVLSDERRTERFLSLTGLDGDGIRARITDPSLLSAVLDFLGAHEPDLIACAEATGHRPEALIRARERLTR